MFRLFSTAAATTLIGLFATTTAAQAPELDVLLLEVDELADGGMVEARIIETNRDDRTLTVHLESTNEMAKLVVPQNAEIVQMGPNNLAERQMDFGDLHAGTRIELEGVRVEDAVRLRIVGIGS